MVLSSIGLRPKPQVASNVSGVAGDYLAKERLIRLKPAHGPCGERFGPLDLNSGIDFQNNPLAFPRSEEKCVLAFRMINRMWRAKTKVQPSSEEINFAL